MCPTSVTSIPAFSRPIPCVFGVRPSAARRSGCAGHRHGYRACRVFHETVRRRKVSDHSSRRTGSSQGVMKLEPEWRPHRLLCQKRRGWILSAKNPETLDCGRWCARQSVRKKIGSVLKTILPHKLATLGCARTGTIDGRCQSPPGCLQSRDVGVELLKFSFRHNGPAPRCFPFSFQRG